ncbi:flagellar biosynthetic protein FliR [Gluconobacter wancherniae]|uniref:flagellar biosynthetic protein FliR n=1 Tax=Gluconobacter wancherniae TaxID=1307955 RepID=UPI001B8D729F|nr:flagellar biosynthetic protein FliR [Gluconobacter wancherniae]MBS1088838.1 flagellar biosynthetic protein FliR [Gluconobacter wancherniae]
MNSGLPLEFSGLSLTVWALAFVLVLCRTGGAIMVMPGLGEEELPMTVRAGIALSISALVLPLVTPSLARSSLEQTAPIGLMGMIAVELFAGILIGWLARLITLSLPIAGQMIAVFSGLSSVLQPDPALGSGSSAVARLMNLLAPLMLLVTGAYILPIKAIIGSYALLPPGGFLLAQPLMHWPFLADATHSVVDITERSFLLGLELSAPFLLISFVWQIMLGIMTRLLPTLQIYNTATPLQIVGGIALLCFLLRQTLTIWEGQAFDILRALPGL